MKILIVGAAGLVGSIVRPALQAEHDCRFYDLKPIPDEPERSIIADVNDDAAVAHAVARTQCVIYLAMGVKPGSNQDVGDTDLAFGVNATGWYRFLHAGLRAGVRRFVYASSLSVYGPIYRCTGDFVEEGRPADAWAVYGLSKRVGEFVSEAAWQRCPEATVVALRLMQPMNEKQWSAWQTEPRRRGSEHWFPIGPNDTRRLFTSAVALEKPGAHIVQASGDVASTIYSHARVHEVLGWRPEGA